jgi:glutaminyl-peptide cyclotransferase
MDRAAFLILIAAYAGCGGSSSPVPDYPTDAAWGHLLAQCDFGPRNPGSPGHAACLEYLVEQLDAYADTVFVQEFRHTFSDGGSYTGKNIIARFDASFSPRMLLGAHWDTRPRADLDPDPSIRDTPILGASDGASGVAVLLGLAQVVSTDPPPFGVDIVFFDLEDYGSANDVSEFCIGSKFFSQNPPFQFPPEAIIIDLVGDSDLSLPQEAYSKRAAPELTRQVWQAAGEAGCTAFRPWVLRRIYDDHVPLIEAGMAAVDVIDIDYAAWHTTGDTPAACSPRSLEQVGRTLVQFLYRRPL